MTSCLCNDSGYNVWSLWRRWLFCQDCAWHADAEKWLCARMEIMLTKARTEYNRASILCKNACLSLEECVQELSTSRRQRLAARELLALHHLPGFQLRLRETEQEETSARSAVTSAEHALKIKRDRAFAVWFPMEMERVRRAAWLRLALEELGLPWDVAWGVAGVACWLP